MSARALTLDELLEARRCSSSIAVDALHVQDSKKFDQGPVTVKAKV